MSRSKSCSTWDFEKDVALIELVRSKPMLYDISSSRYSDNLAKRNAWQDIAVLLKVEGAKCKERWESLRSQQRRHINKQKTKSGQAASKVLRWKYDDQMSFLKEFMKDRERAPSVERGDDSSSASDVIIKEEVEETQDEAVIIHREPDEETDVGIQPTHQVRKVGKWKLPEQPHNASKRSDSETLMDCVLQTKKDECVPHPIDSFFSLMASTVKHFNPIDQHFVKCKVFSLVSEVEMKYLMENQNTSNHQHPPVPSPALSQDSVASTSASSVYQPVTGDLSTATTSTSTSE